ncbi:MAG: ECF transporter S component [Oscillospiraceae bacterium]|nr:ECF transporter S component [Oscillospiraceae bacterium]
MARESRISVNRMVGTAILIAIVVVLQIIGSFIRFGAVSVTIVLVPIVVGAAVYGRGAGAVLGGAFGVVVLINCINGVDIGGNMLWVVNPALTAVLCLIKGIAAGYAAGFVFSRISKKNIYAGAVCAAFACPVVNTGIFIAAMFLFFRETLSVWASLNGFPVVYYAFLIMAGLNFLFELGVNIVLCPIIVRIINAAKTRA